jgi:hypothetical protein
MNVMLYFVLLVGEDTVSSIPLTGRNPFIKLKKTAMWWMPLAWLGWKGLRALIEWDQEQAAQYRCHIGRNDRHTPEEHRRPKFSVSRRAEQVRCQNAVPFVLKALFA